MADELKCDECGSTNVSAATPGLVSCQHCGYVFVPPEGWEPAVPVIADLPPLSATDTDFVIPDSTEVAYGWRAWGVDAKWEPPTVPILRSVTHYGTHWTPRAPTYAECDRPGRANGASKRKHECPEERCTCGLYSAKTFEHLQSMGYHHYDAEANGMFHIVGRVQLWGKVIEGSQGWRAEIGYPDQLYVPFEAHELVEPLEEAYGVQVQLKNILAPTKEK